MVQATMQRDTLCIYVDCTIWPHVDAPGDALHQVLTEGKKIKIIRIAIIKSKGNSNNNYHPSACCCVFTWQQCRTQHPCQSEQWCFRWQRHHLFMASSPFHLSQGTLPPAFVLSDTSYLGVRQTRLYILKHSLNMSQTFSKHHTTRAPSHSCGISKQASLRFTSDLQECYIIQIPH